ncbi:histidinol-phosphatase HisJ family protein [candidate division WOR-3 bacterium]|nr:histidinol-phosphatase HisJ family protein [candidate division WOR-3 bacterium]
MIDYHIHTIFSCDSHLKPEMVCNRAIERDFYEIAFTEHLDLDPQDDGYGYYNYDDITEKISELKSQYNGRLKIKKGVEITYQKEREDEIRRFLNDKDYDFIIGSVHLVNNFDVSHDEGTAEFFKQLDRERAFLSYFEVTFDLVNSGIFDCLGHFEMIRRYALKYIADYSYEEFKKPIDEILETIKKKRIALEVNTSGLRHLPKETYPRMEIVRRFLNLGGKYLTIGSDAHLPEHIGYRIPETMKLLKNMGIEGITLFNKGEKISYKEKDV